MTVLHEILASEKTVLNARDQLTRDTQEKFAKGDSYFAGFTKTLKLLGDSPENADLERAARQERTLPTTVVTTMEYYMEFWAKAENLLFQKNVTNTMAKADLLFKGQVICNDVPVDELMGLEVRLGDLRKLASQIPTLDASKSWEIDKSAAQAGTWKATQEVVTTKTEKVTTPVVLYPATDKHPAQVKETSTDKIVGTFTQRVISGATTAIQKAKILATLDELITEVKQARTRANAVTVVDRMFGKQIVDLVLAPLYDTPTSNEA